MPETTKTPTYITRTDHAPEVPVERLVGPFYFDFAHRFNGDIVPSSQIIDHLLEVKGVGCKIALKPDGVIISLQSPRAAETIMRSLKFSHDYVLAHGAGDFQYHIYVSATRKPAEALKLSI